MIYGFVLVQTLCSRNEKVTTRAANKHSCGTGFTVTGSAQYPVDLRYRTYIGETRNPSSVGGHTNIVHAGDRIPPVVAYSDRDSSKLQRVHLIHDAVGSSHRVQPAKLRRTAVCVIPTHDVRANNIRPAVRLES
ncbi:hypothetical protein CBL_05440 [Carabus blaptoides fortunei]